MLENLPDVIGHVLRDQRAGLDQTLHRSIDLASGTAAIRVASLAFADHAPIPALYTADGDGRSPPLAWTGVPEAAASVLLVVEDADSPTPHPLVHAIVVDLPTGDGALAESALTDEAAREALHVGRNSCLQAGWLPPDPPPGHGVHRYVFQVFALEAGTDFGTTPGRDDVIEAVRTHGLASGCLIGTYVRADTSVHDASTEATLVGAGPTPA